MSGFAEHPDHTGSSGNPSAPWNHPDPELICDTCGHEPDPGESNVGDDCRWNTASALEPCDGHYIIKET